MTDAQTTGGCQCGAVRYTLKRRSGPVYACHCRECQKQTASAFALSMPIAAEDLEVTGRVEIYARPTDSGSTTECVFCPVCGTRLYHRSACAPGRATLKAGTLDDARALAPVAHLWVRSKQPWLVLPEGVPVFETQPADLAAWRTGLSKP